MGEQTPAAAGVADEGGRGRSRAEVEGEECSGLTAHTVMLTGSPTAVAGVAKRLTCWWRDYWRAGGAAVGRAGGAQDERIASGVPGRLFVRVLEPLDELLDPQIIREDFAGHGQLAAEDSTQCGIEEDHRPAAELAVGTTRLQEQDGGHSKAAQLDFAGSLLNEIVALLFRSGGQLNQLDNLLIHVCP